MVAVASGNLRHRVEVQAKTTVQDPVSGALVPTWTTISTPWADIAPLSGREFIAASAEQSEVRAKIVMRYREVNASMRIVHRGMYYNIHAVLPDADSGREHITLMVGEGVRLTQ